MNLAAGPMSQSDESPSDTPVEGRGQKSVLQQKPLSLLEKLRGLFGISGASIRDDIEEALEESSTSSDFSAHEREMLKNVLNLHDVRVDDIMVPRADIIAVGLDSTLAEVLGIFRTAAHSRLPVHGDTLDDPRGMVHIRDLVDYIARAAEKNTSGARKTAASETSGITSFGRIDLSVTLGKAKILRPVLFVPPSMPAIDLLAKMQASRTHMALVIDEYGGTDGLASIEDIVEMIVGDIEDEHDSDDSPSIEKISDGVFICDARASLADVSLAIGQDLSASDDADDVDTLGGLMTILASHVPVRGEIVRGAGAMEFEILDADPRRVKRIRIHTHPVPRQRGGRKTRDSEQQSAVQEDVNESHKELETKPDTDKER